MWGFPKIRGTTLGHNKDCSILGSILGSPYLGKLPCERLTGFVPIFRFGDLYYMDLKGRWGGTHPGSEV